MHSKKISLTNFSRALHSESLCIRPDSEKQLIDYLGNNNSKDILTRGCGLSYSDSCLNSGGLVIDSKRLNHLIRFDNSSGIVECQGGVTFKDLFLLDPAFIPPVIPGTLNATVAGGIAHDVHGKNNPVEGSFGHHIVWIELIIDNQIIRCSREDYSDLFYATIAGLGLTGVITRVAIRLKRALNSVAVEHIIFDSLKKLTEHMSVSMNHYDYQVAWIDLLNAEQRSILSLANHSNALSYKQEKKEIHTVPEFPFSIIRSWNMKLFNKLFIKNKPEKEQLTLKEFNNPLDKVAHWNRLYGPKGLIQFQAVFDQEQVVETLEQLIKLIHLHKATPTLAVLKLFNRSGEGLLSFCRPGFTFAIDFIHNPQAKEAIRAMNQMITEIGGRIYLAKDLLLTSEQYQKMYPHHQHFSQILSDYKCSMRSDLSERLGIRL